MSLFRCVFPLSFVTRGDLNINRGFRVGDEIEHTKRLDKMFETRRGQAFVMIREDAPPAGDEKKELSKMKVEELYDLAAELNLEIPEGLKKGELVKFLEGLTD